MAVTVPAGSGLRCVSRRSPAVAATPYSEPTCPMSALVLSTARLFDHALGRFTRMHLGMLALFLGAGLSIWMVQGLRGGQSVVSGDGDTTSSIESPPVEMGPSGFPVPRFLSLKASKVNVRKGPSSEHAVAWVFQRKGMPVEVIAEFENWRKIRDASGAEGWILQQMLSGRRFAMVPDWNKDKALVLRESAADKSPAVVKLAPGVVAQIDSCSSNWCYLTTDDYEGYAHQTELWGVYPDEVVD
jgi:SH3-like domain-containing protein